jgi:hypothetical protein
MKDMVSGTQETVIQEKLVDAVKKILKSNQALGPVVPMQKPADDEEGEGE